MGIHIILNSILMDVVMTTPTHRLPRLRIGERPLDIMVRREYPISYAGQKSRMPFGKAQYLLACRVKQMCME